MDYLLNFAATQPADGDLLGTLGIDWWTLIFQMIAFLILVWVLGKWVYPVFVQIIDKRQANEERAAKAADEAREQAAKAETAAAKVLKEARAEAGAIVATAKEEANSAVASAEEKARVRAENIVSAAEKDIAKQVTAAKQALKKETVELVASATETVLRGAADSKVNEAVIKDALKEASK